MMVHLTKEGERMMRAAYQQKRALQRERAEYIATMIVSMPSMRQDCPPIGELIATIHLALNATEPGL